MLKFSYKRVDYLGMKGCRPLSDSEVLAVSLSLSLRDKALFILGIKTGLRIAEILSLRVEDILQNNQIVERLTVKKKHTKGKSEGKTIVLHIDARKALFDWIGYLGETTGPLFRSQKGGSISTVHAWRILNRAYQENNILGNTGTHCMRKTFSKKVYYALNKDIFLTQKALNHRSIDSTTSYLSFDQKEIDDVILSS